MESSITLLDEEGNEVVLYILEETRLNGCNYLLAAESEEGDGECVILKEISGDEDEEAVFEPVENEDEAEALLRVFQALMEETGICLEG